MGGVRLPLPKLGCILLPMSFRPVRKIAGIRNVFLETELVDIAEYESKSTRRILEDHEHHGANGAPGSMKIEGTVVGEVLLAGQLRICRDLGPHA
jgi:hypothetical protein